MPIKKVYLCSAKSEIESHLRLAFPDLKFIIIERDLIIKPEQTKNWNKEIVIVDHDILSQMLDISSEKIGFAQVKCNSF